MMQSNHPPILCINSGSSSVKFGRIRMSGSGADVKQCEPTSAK